jgi:hypothetical protein
VLAGPGYGTFVQFGRWNDEIEATFEQPALKGQCADMLEMVLRKTKQP